MRIVFMGTPEFASAGLQGLIDGKYEIGAVVTQPDRPKGRSSKPAPSAVKECAVKNGIKTILQPEKIRNEEFYGQIRALKPDLIVVIAYGKILPPELLRIPARGCINVHASLLPAYRGAWPIAKAIMEGERITGVTTMLMDEGIDTGDILLQEQEKIEDNMTFGQLYECLAALGSDILLKTLKGLESGDVKPRAQTGEASFAPMIRHEDERIDWNADAKRVHDFIRALDPEPAAFTCLDGTTVKCSGSTGTQSYDGNASPGEVIGFERESALVACGTGAVRIHHLLFAGCKRLRADQCRQGRKLEIGNIFT
jgi:methionyl-tRNA formyltransferase